MNRYTIFGLAAAALLATGLALRAADVVPSQGAKVGTAAPAFTLTNQDGKPTSLSDYSGKVVVLEWFNDGCPFVQRHYKDGDMNQAAEAFAPKGVVWLAINSTKETDDAHNKAAAEKWSMNREILNDATGTVGHEYGATNTPNMFVIGKDGTVAYRGAIDNDPDGDKSPGDKINYVTKALTEILAGQTVSTPETKPYGCSIKYAD
jgi:peroxiredoxin